MARQTPGTLPAPGSGPCQGAFLAGPAGPIRSCPPRPRCARRIAAATPEGPGWNGPAGRPGPAPGSPTIALNCCDSLVAARRRPGCGQMAARAADSARRPGPAAAGPGTRSRPARVTAGNARIMDNRPQLPDFGLPWRNCAGLLSASGLQRIAAIQERAARVVAVTQGALSDENRVTHDLRHLAASPGRRGAPRVPTSSGPPQGP